MNVELEKVKKEIDEVYYLTNFYFDRSKLVKFAILFDRSRRKIKSVFLNIPRFFRKSQKLSKDTFNILVRPEGGIGDCVMSLVLIERLKEMFPNSNIYFSYDYQRVADMMFHNDKLIKGFVDIKYKAKNYDLVIMGCQLLNIEYYNKNRIMKFAPEFMRNIQQGLEAYKRLKVFTTFVPVLDGVFANISWKMGFKRINVSGILSGLNLGHEKQVSIFLSEKGYEVLPKYGIENKTYITIHNGLDSNTRLYGRRPTKCWPDSHWKEFVELFKKEFPDITVVQLGGGNSPEYDFVDVCLVNKTKVEDIPYLLKKSVLHVDGESGLVHINKHLGNTSLVLFGPTDPKYYSYDNNINIRSKRCGNCMFITKHWSTMCPLDYDLNETDCMTDIQPATVVEAAAKYVREKYIPSNLVEGPFTSQEDRAKMRNLQMEAILYFHSRKSKLVKKTIDYFRKRNPKIKPEGDFKILDKF